MSVPTANIPVSAKAVNTAYVSLFDLSGGRRWYVLNAADVNVRIYLPAPTAGTRLVFVRGDDAANGYTARVYAKTTATLDGSATAYIDLLAAGDACEVVPNSDADGWLVPSRNATLGW